MIIDNVEDKLYFNTTRNYTLSLISAFDNIQNYVQKIVNSELKTQTETIPIKFAQREKFQDLGDIDTTELTSGNYNFLPRMALSFDTMTKNADRATNKFKKFSKRYEDTESNIKLDYSYNSVPYDFRYVLNIQARGLNQAFQIVEQIMPYFRPTMALEIDEMPIFSERTVTQIVAEDPSFDIPDVLEKADFQLINVSIPITLRGNLYSPITLSAPLETIKMFTYVWTKQEIDKDKLAWEYQLDKNIDKTDWVVTKDIHTP